MVLRFGRHRLRWTEAGWTCLGLLAACLLGLGLGDGPRILVALLVSLLALAPLLAFLNLRRLRLSLPAPAVGYAGSPLPVPVRVASRRRGPARDLVLWHGFEGESLRRPGLFLPGLAGGESRDLILHGRPPRRGRYPRHRLGIQTSFPFGLLEWEWSASLPGDLLVLPLPGRLLQPEAWLPARAASGPERPGPRRGPGEFYELRPWRPGMSQRLVHWRSSARHRRLLVRELREEARPRIHVVLDRRLPEAGGRGAFERAVQLAAGLAEHLLRHRTPVRLSLPGPEGPGTRRAGGHGREALVALLEPLAEIQPLPAEATPILPAAAPGEISLVVRAGGPPRSQARPRALGPGRWLLLADASLGTLWSPVPRPGHARLLQHHGEPARAV